MESPWHTVRSPGWRKRMCDGRGAGTVVFLRQGAGWQHRSDDLRGLRMVRPGPKAGGRLAEASRKAANECPPVLEVEQRGQVGEL